MNRFVAFLMASIVALTIAAAPAFAQTSGSGYSTPAGEVQADVSSNPSSSNPGSKACAEGTTGTSTGSGSEQCSKVAGVTKTASGSQLPFTGLDVGLLLGAGLALLLVGGALSRLTRSATNRTE